MNKYCHWPRRTSGLDSLVVVVVVVLVLVPFGAVQC